LGVLFFMNNAQSSVNWFLFYIKDEILFLFDVVPFALYNSLMMTKWIDKPRLVNVVVVLLFVIFGLYYYQTLINVPFHPDESTYIYMSADFKRLFSEPLGMTYDQDINTDTLQHYRLVDPPLTRYWIGAALSIAGIDSLKEDWNWSLNWQENVEKGAMPDSRMLLVSRLAVSSLFLLALFAIYRTGVLLQNRLTGILSIIFLACNALVLLHTRRAMEEALLLPAICLAIWSFSSINRRPWLAGLAVLMAVNIKLTALPLFLIGVTAIFLLDRHQKIDPAKSFLNLAIFSAVILTGTFILNPVAWSNPWMVIKAAISERSELIGNQLASLRLIDPGLVLDSPLKRLAGLITHSFLSYPAALDVGNYREELSIAIDTYTASFGTRILRGLTGGLVTLALTLFSSLLMLVRVIKKKPIYSSFRFIVLTGFGIFVAAMTVTISLPFQRYMLPLLPFICLISAWGISQVLLPDKKAPA
jgi:hypothetical protein